MPESEFGDGDDGGDEIDAEFIPAETDICTWTNDPEEKRRAFIANLMFDPNIGVTSLINNMHAVCDWLKTGKLPKSHLKVVGSNDGSSEIKKKI